ncbi:hypothetical protein [Marinilabilia salmonicolor]|uniref:hypothetical protein n=1 Tax=Marinilabilia salmonicolor TaxID=989 RepID=UPI0012F679B0|nr:hypothetical protein [Marinilabilia salmonicolor]
MTDGDTIQGELNFQGDLKHAQEIEFQNQDSIFVFKPFDIRGYAFTDGKYYVSKKAIVSRDTVNVFAEYLVKGQKNLYYHRSASGPHYLIDYLNGLITEIPYNDEFINIDGVNYKPDPTAHIGYLKYYFMDCPEIFPQIEKLMVPERKPLVSLTRKYHDITCGEGSCVVFERRKYPFRMEVEPVYSFFLYPKEPFSIENLQNMYGAHLYFWLPNSSERLYLKTGLLYGQSSSVDVFQIPLQFEYVYPAKVFKPKLNIGVNTFLAKNHGFPITVFAGGGCLVKLSDRLFLDFEMSSDLISVDFFRYGGSGSNNQKRRRAN